MLPRLVKMGFNGKIITSHATAMLMKPLLLNCAYILNSEAGVLSYKYKRNYEPLYDESDVYQTLLSIASGGSLVNLTDRQFQEYMHSQEDMELFYSKYPEVLENTTKIANKCLVELEFSGYQLPKYSNEIDASLYLKELCYKGLKKRLIQNNVQNINVYEQRLLYELETIKQNIAATYGKMPIECERILKIAYIKN